MNSYYWAASSFEVGSPSLNKKIFVVEDDEDISRNLKDLLEGEGYTVETAKNGMEALQKLRTGDVLPSLIILDLMMPIMDGFQFRTSQEQDPRLASIPIVIMTAGDNIEAKRLKAGAKAFIRKPVNVDTVLLTVERFAADYGA